MFKLQRKINSCFYFFNISFIQSSSGNEKSLALSASTRSGGLEEGGASTVNSSFFVFSLSSSSFSSMMASILFGLMTNGGGWFGTSWIFCIGPCSSMISTYYGWFLSLAKHLLAMRCCLKPLSPAPMSLWQSGHLLACPTGFHGMQF